MRARTWVTFIVINIIISAAVMLTVLLVWQHVNPAPSASTPGPTPWVIESPVSAPVAPTGVPASAPGPLLYTVQPGDTLGAIAQAHGISLEALMAANQLSDPNVLLVGQELVVPVNPISALPDEPVVQASPEPVGESFATPLPTLTPSAPPLIEIGQVLGSGDLLAEVVVIRNRGGIVSLEWWTLSDAEGNSFTFPALTLFEDTQVRVHSAAGQSMPGDLYWGRETPAWSGGELMTLRDGAGNVVDTYIVP